jgi:hypothetical protein
VLRAIEQVLAICRSLSLISNFNLSTSLILRMVFLLFAKIPPPFLPGLEVESSWEMTSVAITLGLKVYGKPATLSDKPAAHSGGTPKVAGLPSESVAGLLRN